MAEYGRIHTDGSRSGGQPVLEPCPVPWCGSSDVKARSFDANHRRHWIECGKCNFKTPQMPSRTKVITLWNTLQPTHSNIFDVSDVQKHTLIVGQDYASHTVKVKSLDDSQPTQSDALQADIDAMKSILWVDTIIDDQEAIAKAFARHRQYGYDQGYYDGQRDRPPTQSDALREALWAMPEPYEYLNKDQLKSIRPYVDALRNWKHRYRAVLQEQSK